VGLDIESRFVIWDSAPDEIGGYNDTALAYTEEIDALADRVAIVDRGW